MSSRDEDRIKELLKSVRPDYDKAGLWDKLEDKLPQAKKKRGLSVWLFLLLGLVLGAGISYTWFQFGTSNSINIENDYAGSEAQNDIFVPSDDNVAIEDGAVVRREAASQYVLGEKESTVNNGSSKKSEQKSKNTNRYTSSEEGNLQLAQEEIKVSDNTFADGLEFLAGFQRNGEESENIRNAHASRNSIVISDNSRKVDAVQINTADSVKKSISDSWGQAVESNEFEKVVNNSIIYSVGTVPNIGIVSIENNLPKVNYTEFPLVQFDQKSSTNRSFLTIQTNSSLLFTESAYTSESDEWNSFTENAVNPVWSQGINIAYERSLGSGWFATVGIRTSLLTERLETVLENAHQPDVHYSDTAFYYQFDNGIINYYGGQTEYQDKEVRRVGQYNQSLSIGAQLGVKYIKTWSRWSVAPEVSFYAMPYSFTTGKIISQEFDIVQRRNQYQGFYGLQGQCALEYRLSSNYRIFAGLNYQADLSNRLRSQSQMISAAGFTVGTRVSL